MIAPIFRILFKRFCVVYSPELIEEVLVTKRSSFEKGPLFKTTGIVNNPTSITADGEEHRRIRKLIQPAFQRKALNGYAEVMIDEALTVRNGWRDGDTVDVSASMHQMALNIIAKTFFGRDTQIDSNLIRAILEAMRWSMMLTLIPFGKLIARLFPSKKHQRSIEAMDQVVFDVIHKAQTASEERTDLVSFLVHAKDEEGIDRALSIEEVRDESYIMILAGHETSANALAWCFYHLSRNPEARARLEKEIDEILGWRPPTLEDYNRLPYTRAVFEETLRLTPPLYIVGRTATEDCVLGSYSHSQGNGCPALLACPSERTKNIFLRPMNSILNVGWETSRRSTQDTPTFRLAAVCVRVSVRSFAKMEGVFALSSITQQWAGQRYFR